MSAVECSCECSFGRCSNPFDKPTTSICLPANNADRYTTCSAKCLLTFCWGGERQNVSKRLADGRPLAEALPPGPWPRPSPQAPGRGPPPRPLAEAPGQGPPPRPWPNPRPLSRPSPKALALTPSPPPRPPGGAFILVANRIFTERDGGEKIADMIRHSWDATVVDLRASSRYPVIAE